jgi:hypothetical protein
VVGIRNTWEGGTDGVAPSVANSGGTSGNAFTSIVGSTASVCRYSTLAALEGLLGVRFSYTGNQSAAYVWVLPATADRYAVGARFRSNGPASGRDEILSLRPTSGSTASVFVNSSGQLEVGSGSNTIATTGDPLTWGASYYIEFAVRVSTGALEVNLYPLGSASPVKAVNVTGAPLASSSPLGRFVLGRAGLSELVHQWDVDDLTVENLASGFPARTDLPSGHTSTGLARALALASSVLGAPVHSASATASAWASASSSSSSQRVRAATARLTASADGSSATTRVSSATALAQLRASSAYTVAREAFAGPALLHAHATSATTTRRLSTALALAIARAYASTGANETHVSTGLARALAAVDAVTSARRISKATGRALGHALATDESTRTARGRAALVASATWSATSERVSAELALALARAFSVTSNPSSLVDVELIVGELQGYLLSVGEPGGHPFSPSEVHS